VVAGLVTVEGAKRYGVIVDADGNIDEAATASLRKQMAAKRGKKKIFDRGFESIDELKARCKAETGFDPPAQPRFTKWAAVAAEAMMKKKGSKAA